MLKKALDKLPYKTMLYRNALNQKYHSPIKSHILHFFLSYSIQFCDNPTFSKTEKRIWLIGGTIYNNRRWTKLSITKRSFTTTIFQGLGEQPGFNNFLNVIKMGATWKFQLPAQYKVDILIQDEEDLVKHQIFKVNISYKKAHSCYSK